MISIRQLQWSGYIPGHVRSHHIPTTLLFSCEIIRYANTRHPYAFPRVTSMLGDGKTSYNYGNDGEGQELGACSVSSSALVPYLTANTYSSDRQTTEEQTLQPNLKLPT